MRMALLMTPGTPSTLTIMTPSDIMGRVASLFFLFGVLMPKGEKLFYLEFRGFARVGHKRISFFLVLFACLCPFIVVLNNLLYLWNITMGNVELYSYVMRLWLWYYGSHIVKWLSYYPSRVVWSRIRQSHILCFITLYKLPLIHIIIVGYSKPRWSALLFECKLLICIHLGGVFPSLGIMLYAKYSLMSCKSYYCHLTPKRGRLEEHSLKFCVLVNNSRIQLICVVM